MYQLSEMYHIAIRITYQIVVDIRNTRCYTDASLSKISSSSLRLQGCLQ